MCHSNAIAALRGWCPSKPRPLQLTGPAPRRAEEAGLRFKLRLRSSAVSAPPDLPDKSSQSRMKRSHNYSSSDSDLDDNVDVEKDSGDENR